MTIDPQRKVIGDEAEWELTRLLENRGYYVERRPNTLHVISGEECPAYTLGPFIWDEQEFPDFRRYVQPDVVAFKDGFGLAVQVKSKKYPTSHGSYGVSNFTVQSIDVYHQHSPNVSILVVYDRSTKEWIVCEYEDDWKKLPLHKGHYYIPKTWFMPLEAFLDDVEIVIAMTDGEHDYLYGWLDDDTEREETERDRLLDQHHDEFCHLRHLGQLTSPCLEALNAQLDQLKPELPLAYRRWWHAEHDDGSTPQYAIRR